MFGLADGHYEVSKTKKKRAGFPHILRISIPEGPVRYVGLPALVAVVAAVAAVAAATVIVMVRCFG